MRTSRKLLLPLGAGLDYALIAASLNPLLWYKFNEPSGTTVINYGSLGSGQNGTYSNATLAQTGQLGAGQAALWNGITTYVQVPATAALETPTARTWCFLHNPTSGGEGNNGRLYNWANAGNALFQTNVNKVLYALIATSATTATSLTPSNFITLSAWQWSFITYDDAGDRKIRFYKGVSGAVTEATYSTQTAATGTLAATGGDLFIGNRQLADQTYDGLIDEVIMCNSILTTAQMLQMTLLSGLV